MIIAVVGAGGKTTLSNYIGKRLTDMGRRVLFTTTTKIFIPADDPLYLGTAENMRSLGPFMTAAKGFLGHGKLEGYSPKDITSIDKLGLFDDIIVEADGAAQKPVKAPNETEPVYPSPVDLIIGVIGLDCIGQPVTDQLVHRAALFSHFTQAAIGESVTSDHILRLISHPEGLFRRAPAYATRVVFLNKYDTIGEKARLEVKGIIRQSPYPAVLTGYNTDWFREFRHRFLGDI